MPGIRIRPILADPSGLPSGMPVRRATGEDFGGGVGAIAYQAGRDLRDTGLSGMDQLLKVQKELQKEDENLDISTKIGQLKIDYANREAQIRDSGQVEPKDYAVTVNNELVRMAREAESTLKYPESLNRFRAHLSPFMTEQAVAGIHTGVKLQHAQLEVMAGIQNEEDAKQAVLGTPEEQAAAQARGLGRIESFVRRGIWSGEKGASEAQKFIGSVVRGQAIVAWDKPAERPLVAEALISGRLKSLSVEQQRALLDHLQTQERTQQDRQRAADERAREQIVSGLEKDMMDAVTAKDFTRGSAILQAGREHFKGTEYRTWQDIITKAQADTPSDPDVLKRLELLTLSADTVPQIRLARQEVLRAGAAGSLNMRTDGDRLGNRLQTRQISQENLAESRAQGAQNRAEARLNHQHSETRHLLEEALKAPVQFAGLNAVMDPQIQDVKIQALEDFDRNSAAMGIGKEAPADWYARTKTRWLGLAAQLGEQRIINLRSRLDFPDEKTLAANQARYPNRKDYLDQVRILEELEELPAWTQFYKSKAGTGAGTAGSGTPAPSAPLKAEPTRGGK